jgi:hypothetical protein
MADEPTGAGGGPDAKKSESDSSDFKKFATAAATIISILVGLNALTGFNPLKDIIEHESTPTPAPVSLPPSFVTHSQDWLGPCNDGCPMSATFQNYGGDGAGTATFHVAGDDGNFLADCTAILPHTPKDGFTSAECTAYSSALQEYLDAGGEVTMLVLGH